MASTDVSIRLAVEGTQKAVTDLAAVGAGLDSAARAAQHGASAFGALSKYSSTAGIERLGREFQAVGVHINAASRHVSDLAVRMQRVARERAFERLGADANLSALQIARLRAGMGDMRGALSSLGRAAAAAKLGIAATGAALLYAGKACLDAQIQMQRLEQSYKSVFGEGAGAQLQAVYEQTDRVGLKFIETAEAAKSFFAAGRDTALAPELNGIFAAVTNAGAALQLSTEQVNGTFIALGQMMSKGKVQAEELRGQLGERLPGAFGLAAKAMGMTTAELDKFMADGKLTAEDLLPKLAQALQDKYGGAAEAAADTLQGSINRMSTEWERFKAGALDSGPAVFVIQVVTELLKSTNDADAQAKADADIENQLAGMGIGPDQDNVAYDSWGGAARVKSYSSGLLGWMRNMNAAASEELRIAEEQARKQENAIAKGRTAIDKALKGTAQARVDALRAERAQTETEINAMIEAYKDQGQGTADLEAKKSAALAAIDAKIAQAGKKGAAAARSAATAQAGYTGALERTRAQIDSLQQQLALDEGEDFARARIKAEQQYQTELAKTRAELQQQVSRGTLTQAQAAALQAEKDKAAELQKQVSLRNAEAAASEKAVRLAEGQLAFYKELGDLGGRYENHLELQAKLIDEQAQKYKDLKIPPKLIEGWRKLKLLQVSTDPFDGAYRGLLRFSAEFADAGKQWENIAYGFAADFDKTTKSMFDGFLETGRVSFDSLTELFRQLLKDMAYQALVRPIVLNVVSGVSGALFGATSVAGDALGGGNSVGGASGAGGLAQAGAGLAQNYATSQLFSSAGGMFSGITDSINAGVAKMFPSMFSPTATQTLVFNPYTSGTPGYAMSVASPTPTFTGMLGNGLMAGGLGSLGYGLLGGAIGLPQNQYTGITSGLGGGLGYMGGSMLSTGLGATLGAFGSAVPVIGTILGTLAGGLLGGLIGGPKEDPPELVLNMSADLWRKLGDQSTDSYNNGIRYQDSNNAYWTTSEGYEGLDWGTESAAGNALGQAMRPILEQSWAIADALKGVNEDMAGQYLGALESMGTLRDRIQFEGEYITGDNIENWIRGFADQAQDRMVSALGAVDLQPLTVAADGLAADTMDELSKALADVFSFFDLGAVFESEEVRSKFERQAAQQITDAFAGLDLSFLRLDFDQSSFSGLQQAYAAVQAWDTVTAGLEAVLNPASELSTALNAATTQFDGWIANLKALGWQEEAIAEIEQQRAVYLEQYRAAAVRASEQDLALRAMALQLGTDSDTYGLAALQYQQENELAQLAKQYGTDSGIYSTAVEIQQAELAQKRVDQLEAELQKALAAEQQAAQAATQAQQSALREQASTARNIQSAFEAVLEALKDARQDIWASSDDNLLGSSHQESRAAFEAAYAKGMAGDTDALRDLPSLAHALLASGRDSLATSLDYSDLFYEVDAKLKAAQGFASEEHDSQTAVVDKLEEQLAAMQAQTAVSEYTGRSVEAIRAELEAVKAVLEKEKADVTAPGSLSQREALLQAKANQLNAQGHMGRTDWTAQSTLNEIYRQGLTLESWYDTFGKHEGLGVEYDTAAARAAILANKEAQLNAGKTLAPGQQAGGWTGGSVLDAIGQAGLTLDQWFLKYGLGEGISSAYKPTASSPDYWQLMVDKAARLNAEGDPRRDRWTPDDVIAEIANQGMSVQQWYDLYGRQEGFTLKAAASTNKVVEKGLSGVDKGMDAQLAATGALGGIMDGVGSSVAGYMGAVQAGLGGLSSSIAGLDWSVTVNVTGGGGGSTSTSTGGGSGGSGGGGSASKPGVDTSDPNARLSSPTGIYGSYYKSETALLWAKMEALNSSKDFRDLPSGYAFWTLSSLRQVIKDMGMTPESWYKQYGKAEGFASGGVTPAFEPFWVGERGPELLMAPRQYGVLSNPDSMALLRGLDAAEVAGWESRGYSVMPPAYDYAPPAADRVRASSDNAALLREIRELKGYLRQILTKTDAAAYAGGKLLGLHRLWDAEGLPRMQDMAQGVAEGITQAAGQQDAASKSSIRATEKA